MSRSRMSAVVSSTVGSEIQPMMSAGAPAATAASRTIFAAWHVEALARGCGAKITAFLVFRASRALKMAVEVGFVVGTTAAMTPTGAAIFVIPWTGSDSMTPQVFVSLYLL